MRALLHRREDGLVGSGGVFTAQDDPKIINEMIHTEYNTDNYYIFTTLLAGCSRPGFGRCPSALWNMLP
jgi:hypothetical protein